MSETKDFKFSAEDFKKVVAEVIDFQWYALGPEAIADKANLLITPLLEENGRLRAAVIWYRDLEKNPARLGQLILTGHHGTLARQALGESK